MEVIVKTEEAKVTAFNDIRIGEAFTTVRPAQRKDVRIKLDDTSYINMSTRRVCLAPELNGNVLTLAKSMTVEF